MNQSSAQDKDVFISYRRAESDPAGRLYEHLLGRHLGWNLFFDVDTAEPGSNFLHQIDQFLRGIDHPLDRGVLVLALIGHQWNPIVDEVRGRRRLDSDRDYVRHELEVALNRGVPILPILFEDARMPGPDELPDSLSELSLISALQLRHRSYKSDMDEIVSRASAILDKQQGKSVKAKLEHSDSRSRSVTVILRREQHLIYYRTLHSGRHFLSVDGRALTEPELHTASAGQRLLYRIAWNRFELSDGPTSVLGEVNVRYMTDFLRIRAFEVKIDQKIVYSEGKVT